MSKPTPEDWARAIKEAREALPMEPEIWAAGADLETAHFVAGVLRRRGFYLVRPADITLTDIERFHAALAKGQSIREDAGGFMERTIRALLNIQPSEFEEHISYRDAAKALLEGLPE